MARTLSYRAEINKIQRAVGRVGSVEAETATVENVVPVGGTTGQVLAKASDADNDLEWVTPSSGGVGASIDDAMAVRALL